MKVEINKGAKFLYLFAIFDVQSPDEHLEALISQAQYGSCKATQSTQVIARSHLKKIIFGYCISKNHFGFITSDLRSLIGNFDHGYSTEWKVSNFSHYL